MSWVCVPVFRPVKRSRAMWGSDGHGTSVSISSTALAPRKCYTSFCPTGLGDVRYGTTGSAVPGYELRLIDHEGLPVPNGAIRELQIAGPTCAVGYWNNRQKTRQTFQGPWVRSGAKHHVDESGHYVYAGRSDDMHLRVSCSNRRPPRVQYWKSNSSNTSKRCWRRTGIPVGSNFFPSCRKRRLGKSCASNSGNNTHTGAEPSPLFIALIMPFENIGAGRIEYEHRSGCPNKTR